MKPKTPKYDVGIIVGRFQVHELHTAHVDLIQSVRDRHDRVILFLGSTQARNSLNNPLPFYARQQMILEKFPDIEIYEVSDHPSNKKWCSILDGIIQSRLLPVQKAVLYGSRESFIDIYKSNGGKFDVCELEATEKVSGTELRRKVCNSYHPNKDFRAGMIAASASRFPTAYPTVDVAIINDKDEVLLVRKPNESRMRFLGGFSDPRSNSLEEDAKRETAEECGVEIDEPVYIGSTKIDDWRYRGEVDCVKTSFFVAKYLFGTPKAADDVCEAKWRNIYALRESDIVEAHHVLLDMLVKWKENQKPKSARRKY